MAEDSSKTEIEGNKVLSQRRRVSVEPGSAMNARVSRRGLIKIAAAFGAMLLAKKSVDAVKEISDSLRSRLTDEQKEAYELLQSADNQNSIEGLVIKEVKGVDGKITDVKLRDKPSSHIPQDPGDEMAGREIGVFKAGTIFSKGILVDGTDPRFGGVRKTHDRWVYVNPSGEPKDGGFINIGGFEYNPKFYEVPVIKLASFNNP